MVVELPAKSAQNAWEGICRLCQSWSTRGLRRISTYWNRKRENQGHGSI